MTEAASPIREGGGKGEGAEGSYRVGDGVEGCSGDSGPSRVGCLFHWGAEFRKPAINRPRICDILVQYPCCIEPKLPVLQHFVSDRGLAVGAGRHTSRARRPQTSFGRLCPRDWDSEMGKPVIVEAPFSPQGS